MTCTPALLGRRAAAAVKKRSDSYRSGGSRFFRAQQSDVEFRYQMDTLADQRRKVETGDVLQDAQVARGRKQQVVIIVKRALPPQLFELRVEMLTQPVLIFPATIGFQGTAIV